MAGELLGSATLELGGDIAPLAASLKDAEARAAQSVAVIQGLIDSLHGTTVDVNIRERGVPGGVATGAAGTAATRSVAAAPAVGSSPTRSDTSNGAGGLWGVRGPQEAGSIRNPVVMVLESSKYTPMGSYAASIGIADGTDSQRTNSNAGLASIADIRALNDQLQSIAQELSPAAQLAQAGNNGLLTPAATQAVQTSSSSSSSDAAQVAAMQQAADALSAIRGQLTSQTRALLSAPTPSPTSTASHGELTPVARSSSSSRGGSGFNTTQPIPVIIESRAGSGATAFAGGRGGSGGGGASAGVSASGGGQGGGGGGPGFGVSAGAPGGGGGGNRRVDIYHHSSSEGGGGDGGSRIMRTLLGGKRSEPDSGESPFSLANLFKGDEGRGGAFGLPGFGSIGSLGGLGLEHWLLTSLGLGVSAGSAVGGAALTGTASLTKGLIGGGSDLLVNKATSSQIEATTKDYSALQTAVAEYGKNSQQAAAAQNLLTYSIQQMGAAAPAELKVYQDVKKVHDLFEQDSTLARTEAAQGMDNIVQLGTVYTPLVTQAAAKNLAIINSGLKPLFSWLEGPQGIAIFNSLETSFATGLPTSIHALDMAVEDFLRLMQATLPYTGGLSQDLNNFFTDKNKEDAADYDAEVQKLVGDLREWEQLLGVLGEDMGGVFKDDAGTANSIVQDLTQMLERLHDWEQSSGAQGQLKTVFAVHKQQILELLNLLPELLKGYGSFYLDVAPPLVKSISDIASVVAKLAGAIESLPGGADLIGLSIVLGKLGVLGPSLKATAAALGLMTGAEAKNAPAATADASANAKLDTSLAAGGASGAARDAETVAAAGTGATVEEAAGGAGAAGILSGKLGGLFDKIASSGVGEGISGGVVGAGVAGANVAESAGLSSLADSIGAAGAAVAPVAAALVPLLAAAGGVVGLVELFKLFSGSSNGYGDTIANNVAKGLGLSDSDTAGLAKSLNAAKQATAPSIAETGGRGGVSRQTPAADTAKSVADYKQAGQQAGQAFVLGMQQVKFPTTIGVLEEMQAGLEKLPPQARDIAAQTMLGYAQELTAEGKLPKNAVAGLISDLEGQFPGLTNYLVKNGMTSASEFASQMKMTEALSNSKSAITELQNEFGQTLFPSIKLTSGNMLSAVTSDFTKLKSAAVGQVGEMRTQALQQLSQLKETALSDATAMEQGVSQKMLILKNSITSGSSSAVNSATSDFQSLASNIANAMSSGEIATSKGGQLIAEALNAMLKSLGAKPIPLVALQGDTASQLLGEQHYITAGGTTGGAGGAPGLHAAGGLVQIGQPGQGGRDTVPLNVNGKPIMVAPGEQVAVFNRHQLPIVNQALAPMGGLQGLFNMVQTPNYMASGGLVDGSGRISAPGVTGSGTIATITGAVLKQIASAANTILGKDTAASSSGGGGGGIGTGGLSGSLIQIVHEIAKKMGWGAGLIQDWLNVIGAESGGSMTATNSQSGAYGIAQMNTGTGVAAAKAKYYQYGGNPNTMVGQLVAMANYMQDSYGGPAGAWESEETRHSYALGGLLPGYATGGQPSTSALSPAMQAFVKTAPTKPKKQAPKAKKAAGLSDKASLFTPGKTLGAGGPLPFDASDLTSVNDVLKTIFSLDGGDSNGISAGSGGDANQWWDLVSWNTGTYWPSSLFPSPNFSSIASPSDFVISQDQYGNAVTPYIAQPNLDQVVQQLTQAIGWQQHGTTDLAATLIWSDRLPAMIKTAIARRQAQVKKIKARIKANLDKIAALRKRITAAQSQVKALRSQKLPYPNAKTKEQRAANSSFGAQRTRQVASLGQNINMWQAQIKPYQAENKLLGGDEDSVGTGGELGDITAQLGGSGSGSALSIAEGGGGSASGLQGLLPTVQGWSTQLGGTGGDVASQGLTLSEWQQDLLGLAPGASQALAATIAQAASSSAATTDSDLASLIAEQNTLTAETNAVTTAQTSVFTQLDQQMSVLSNLPPYGGSFSAGGIVPGPVGAAATIIAHGGEVITPVGGGDNRPIVVESHHHHHWNGKKFDGLVDTRIQTASRAQGRQVRKALPGRGGGLVPVGR